MNFSYLPAWRWVFPTFHTNYGIADAFTSALMDLAQILFNTADLIWYIILWVVKIATDANLIASATGGIDKVAGAVYGALAGVGGSNQGAFLGGMVVLICAYTIWRVIRSGPGMALRTGFRCAVPLVLLVLMGNAASADHGTGTVPLSPGWVATHLNGYVSELGAFIPSIIPKESTQPSGAAAPNCSNYENGLQQEFAQSAAASPASSGSQAAAGIPETVSQLWQAGWLDSWEFAQYGNTAVGERVGCRQLEADLGVPPRQTPTFGGTNPTPAGQKQIELAGGAAPPRLNSGVYNTAGDSQNLNRLVTAFASCSYNGSAWVVTQAMGGVSGGPGGGDCATWWQQGQLQPNGNDVFCTACNGQTSGNIQSNTGSNTTANTIFQAWNGHNASLGAVDGLVSLFSAAIYAFALGGLSMGTVLAQILLIALLAMLPLLLLLMALPSEQSSAVAAKALRIGLGAAVSKIVFIFILGLLVDLIAIINAIPGISNGTGVGAVLMTALTPLVAFFALHYVLKSAGMSGILGIKGAIATTAAITSAPARGGAGLTGPEQRLHNRIRHPLSGGQQGTRLGSQLTKRDAVRRPGGSRSPNTGARTDPRRYMAKRSRTSEQIAATQDRRAYRFHESLGWVTSLPGGVAAAQGVAGTVAAGRMAHRWTQDRAKSIGERGARLHQRVRSAGTNVKAKWATVRDERRQIGAVQSMAATQRIQDSMAGWGVRASALRRAGSDAVRGVRREVGRAASRSYRAGFGAPRQFNHRVRQFGHETAGRWGVAGARTINPILQARNSAQPAAGGAVRRRGGGRRYSHTRQPPHPSGGGWPANPKANPRGAGGKR